MELQQLQIKEMNEWRKAHMTNEHNAPPQQPSSVQEASEYSLATDTGINDHLDSIRICRTTLVQTALGVTCRAWQSRGRSEMPSG